VSQPQRTTVIAQDLFVQGQIKKGDEIEVYGRIDGTIAAERLRIHPGGRVYGNVSVADAEINGVLQGDVSVKNLIAIGSSGSVNGNVRYGKITMAAGGELSADVRNVPPEVGGDFSIVVRRGRSVRITTADLTAIDPDDTAQSLVYSVSNTVNGFVALASAPQQPKTTFAQADLEAGAILFVHDGSTGTQASFDVVVTDKAGARSSGPPQTIAAAVVEAG
jgi:cytoskeletal protein CcmA (bactofilin family)